MGMFDTIDVSDFPLPMPRADRWKHIEAKELQTKSLERLMIPYRLTADGRLERPTEFSYVDFGDSPELKPKNDRGYVLEPFSGVIRMYMSTSKYAYENVMNTWLEFCALFERGQLITLDRVSPREG